MLLLLGLIAAGGVFAQQEKDGVSVRPIDDHLATAEPFQHTPSSPEELALLYSPLNGSTKQCMAPCGACTFFIYVDHPGVVAVSTNIPKYLVRLYLDGEMEEQYTWDGSSAVFERHLPYSQDLTNGKHTLVMEVVYSSEVVERKQVQFSVVFTHTGEGRLPRKVAISFAEEQMTHALRRLGESTIRPGGFDEFRSFRHSDVDMDYMIQHSGSLCLKRGAGYWLWKPYIVNRTLHQLEDGDILAYADAGLMFVEHAEPLFQITLKDERGIVTFDDPNEPEYVATKRDAFVIMDADEPKYTHTTHLYGGFVMFRVGEEAKRFVREWMVQCEDPRLLLDGENEMGKDNYEGYIGHRHDQSVMSILAKKWNLTRYRHPTHLYNHAPHDPSVVGDYGAIMYLHRFRNAYFGKKRMLLPSVVRGGEEVGICPY